MNRLKIACPKKEPAASVCLCLVILTFGLLPLKAQNAQADAFLQRQMEVLGIPGMQVAVVRQGKIAFLKAYGFANVQDSVKTTNRSIFPINSCTKAFTGIAIMQLVEEGKIDLNAPVSRYLEDLPTAWQPVTIRQLLTHVSGLPDILRLLNPATHGFAEGDNEEKMWAKIKAMPMDFKTGEQFSYNQTNYALLGKIIDKYSGKPFETVFRERQFQPAHMTRTLFADARDIVPGLVQNYRYATRWDGLPLDTKKLAIGYAEFPAFHHTASGLNSTAEDLAQWIIALQQQKLLKTKAALNTLWTAGTYNNGQPTQWALGWMTRPRTQHRAIIATGGGRSVFCVYPEDDFAVIVLTNLSGCSPEDFIDELVGYFNPEIAAADPITRLRIQLQKQGFENAIPIVAGFKKKDGSFTVPETELNDWGYRLMGSRQIKEAIALFKLVIWLYPDSWNAYDSYGEGLLKDGQKEEAIKMYQKSVELYPDNHNGKKILAQLLK